MSQSIRPDLGTEFDAVLSRHGPEDARTRLGEEALENLLAGGSTPIEADVVVGDLRMSAIVLKEAVKTSLYARFIIGFTEAVRSLANGSGGWFDRFTGDGFIAYWVRPAGDDTGTADVPEFCRAVLPAAESLIANLRRNSRNFPVGVGLSLGADSGPCELVLVGGALTLVGGPIVGATRMVAGAEANRTLVNVYLGERFERDGKRLAEAGIRVERTSVSTKEYPQGQVAYELLFSQLSTGSDPSVPGVGNRRGQSPPSTPK
jgi:class 3 adenylate cyclase